MNRPFVSMLVPTYRRFPDHEHLLAECVEGFLRSTYPADRREMIILNDTPNQTVVCDAPGVRILNKSLRYRSIGMKRQALAMAARGTILLPQDDDDISLPGRITRAVEELSRPGVSAFHEGGYFFWDGAAVTIPPTIGYCHNCSAFTLEALAKVGGYPDGPVDDAPMMARLRHGLNTGFVRSTGGPTTWTTLYRWGVSPHHLSGTGDMASAYEEIGKRPVVKGVFEIKPRWLRDYPKLCADAAKGAA